MFKRLHPLFNADGDIGAESGVEDVSAAEGQEVESYESGEDNVVAAEPEKQDGYEKAFSKKLAAERAKMESEYAERYKDYDTHKELSDYLTQVNGMDAMSLKEQIELERLQTRAEQDGISVELQKRLDVLESKAAKADEMEQQQQQREQWQEYESSLKTYCEGKEIDGKQLDHKELWKYMHENGTSKPEVAFKAMRHDVLEQQLQSAKKDGVKEFLSAKGSIPTVQGANAQGQVISATPKTFAEARARAMQR